MTGNVIAQGAELITPVSVLGIMENVDAFSMIPRTISTATNTPNPATTHETNSYSRYISKIVE